jgi:hypothetical protein
MPAISTKAANVNISLPHLLLMRRAGSVWYRPASATVQYQHSS